MEEHECLKAEIRLLKMQIKEHKGTIASMGVKLTMCRNRMVQMAASNEYWRKMFHEKVQGSNGHGKL